VKIEGQPRIDNPVTLVRLYPQDKGRTQNNQKTHNTKQAPMPYNFFFAEQTFFAQICVLSQSNLSISLFENILRLK